MSPKPDVSEQRRSQILDAAMETFSKMGFYKTRMSDIADTSGLSKGSLYWYFDSKNDIILHLLARVFEPELEEFQALLDQQGSAEARLFIYAERAADDMVKMLKWMPLIYDFIALAFRQEKVKKAISLYYQKNMAILETLLQQGTDQGEFQTRSAREAAIAIGAILEGTIVLWFYDPDEIDIKTHIMTNISLLVSGLKYGATVEMLGQEPLEGSITHE
jgi:AcrR family transcriptional regulator